MPAPVVLCCSYVHDCMPSRTSVFIFRNGKLCNGGFLLFVCDEGVRWFVGWPDQWVSKVGSTTPHLIGADAHGVQRACAVEARCHLLFTFDVFNVWTYWNYSMIFEVTWPMNQLNCIQWLCYSWNIGCDTPKHTSCHYRKKKSFWIKVYKRHLFKFKNRSTDFIHRYSPDGGWCTWRLKDLPGSASFLAEISVRSPRFFIFSLPNKNIFWIKEEKKPGI